MRIARYRTETGAAAWGVVEGEALFVYEGELFGAGGHGAEVGPLSEATLLAPVTPSKILCIGRNYAAHAAELGNEVPPEPMIFLKPPSALIGPGDTIELPPLSQRVEHEAELAVVIGRRCRHLSEEEAMGAIGGYTIANDVTARDLQRKDGQWSRAKGFDTFCPVGPWLVTADALDPTALRVQCRVNGETRQDGNTQQFIFGLPRLLHDLSAVFTLEPGDLILTGTPAGVGPLLSGDEIEIEIEGLGILRNHVKG